MSSQTRTELLSLVALLAFSLAMSRPAVAYDYSVEGTIAANTWGGDEIYNAISSAERTWLEDSAHAEGPYDDLADASYFASLSSGEMEVSAYAVNHIRANGWSFAATANCEDIIMLDDLTFTIPPGDYPEGVWVALEVHVEGLVWVDGNHGGAPHVSASASWSFGIGAYSADDSQTVWNEDAELVVPINQDYTEENAIFSRICPPGSYSTPQVTVCTFHAQVNGNAHPATATHAGEASSHLLAQVLSLNVPDGVTWTSASGVFLSDCREDLNGNGGIDLSDLATLLGAYGSCWGDPDFVPAVDLNDDNCINLSDLAQLLGVYGQDCPTG